MPTPVIKIKNFESALFKPATPTPDGSSIEEQVTAFLATIDPKNLVDVVTHTHTGGKLGLTTQFFATVTYKE